jgi:hypothetical protein
VRRPNTARESGPWRVSGIEPDLQLEAVWALPAHGGAGDFQALLDQMNRAWKARVPRPARPEQRT